MSEEQRGVVLYRYGVDAVAEALPELDPRYALVDRVAPGSGQVPVLRCLHAAEADAARKAAPGVAWSVVELYRPEVAVEHARDPLLVLNMSKVDPGMAARAIDQPDYSNIAIIMPDGHRMVAHAVRAGGAVPECLPSSAEQVLPSHDLWALARLREIEVCQACTARHG